MQILQRINCTTVKHITWLKYLENLQQLTFFLRCWRDDVAGGIKSLFEDIMLNVNMLLTRNIHSINTEICTQINVKHDWNIYVNLLWKCRKFHYNFYNFNVFWEYYYSSNENSASQQTRSRFWHQKFFFFNRVTNSWNVLIRDMTKYAPVAILYLSWTVIRK